MSKFSIVFFKTDFINDGRDSSPLFQDYHHSILHTKNLITIKHVALVAFSVIIKCEAHDDDFSLHELSFFLIGNSNT